MIATGHAHEMVEMDDLLTTVFIPRNIYRQLSDGGEDSRRPAMLSMLLMQAGNMHQGMEVTDYTPDTWPPALDMQRVTERFIGAYFSATGPERHFTVMELNAFVRREAFAVVEAIWQHLQRHPVPQHRRRHVRVGNRPCVVTEPVISVVRHEPSGSYISWR